MKVIILAGGYGTRLSEETDTIPKPMIQIGGKPLLWHLMKSFSHYGLNDFTVALGYKSEVIKKFFLDYPTLQSDLRINLGTGSIETARDRSENWNVELVETGANSMTGGRLRRLNEQLNSTFIFTYGDGLSDINLEKLVAFHKSHGKLATVTAVRPTQRFGVMKLSSESQVTSFAEKPEVTEQYVNGGFFVLEPEVIDLIRGDDVSWEKEPCERLAETGQLMAYRHEGYWQCVDTLHELRLLRQLWDEGKAEWKTW